MIGRLRSWQRRTWHDRSKAARVELQSVIVTHCTFWVFSLSWLMLPLLSGLRPEPVPRLLGGLLLLLGALQCVVANRCVRPVLDHYLGRAELPPGALRAPVGLLVLGLALLVLLDLLDAAPSITVRLVLGATLMPFGMLYSLLVPLRVFLRQTAVLAAVLALVLGLTRLDAAAALGSAVMVGFVSLFCLLTSRCGAWTLSVLWEAERAREVEAQLAVAEERLRFGRDLHDVLGRNLAVIALKSELAVQLARRGRPEAVEQMIEVQRLAQESQREVREVVRGYREADLGKELAGAQGVLTAAGIECTVSGSAVGLPPLVQSALGWVVREAATNVLRHGDARHCAVTLEIKEGRAVLSVENDGAPRPGPNPGAGLTGLRERLSKVDGTLRAGPDGRGSFRLTAEVPLSPTEPFVPPRTVSEVTP
ncbi:sensor histidine kinase [Streptomyces gibsoniae]|uniref:Sensor histidine kinase n=1 Tax=Streptomyces gibsoniae TaxID=3075529 RepID=A0ABU2TUJ2_9ACTN|nr:sensor histidine kinase [Streptomyces sp. DSM 41699]MDT0464576.1 sensor histidine kinase [Streptomyces sp. DSM 41699]